MLDTDFLPGCFHVLFCMSFGLALSSFHASKIIERRNRQLSVILM